MRSQIRLNLAAEGIEGASSFRYLRCPASAPLYMVRVRACSIHIIVFLQIMVTFLSYISNACHSFRGVAERLQHMWSPA